MNKYNMTKNLIFKIISLGVSFFATMFITKIVVNTIGNKSYGFYSMSNDFVNYAIIITIALNSMGGRYITMAYYKRDYVSLNKYFNSIFYSNIIVAITLLVVFVAIVFNLDKIIVIPSFMIEDVKILFAIMFLNFLISIISSVFSVATFVKNRVDLDSIRAAEAQIVKVGCITLLFYVFIPHIWYVGIATVLSTIYVFVINIYYVKKFTPEIQMFKIAYFDWKYVKEILKSGIWNSFTRIGAILLSGVDLLIANLYISTSAMGVLSVSKTLPKLIINAISNFATAFIPKITISYAQEDKKKCVYNIKFAIGICTLVSVIIQSIVIVLGKKIYMVWMPGEDIKKIYVLTVIAMLGYMILMPFECLYSVFTVTNKLKISSIYMFIESIITIIIVLLCMNTISSEFIKICVIAGVSSVVEILRGITFLPLYSAHCLRINKNTFYKPLIKVIIMYVMVIVLSSSLCSRLVANNWLHICIQCAIIIVIAFVIWWLIGLDKEIRNDLKRYIKRS